MNPGIRRVAAGIIVLFVGLVAQLTYLQVAHSDRLADDPRNARGFLQNAQRDRGPIVSADGVIVAESKPAGDEFKHQRVYPKETAALFASVVGSQSILFGETGVEKTYSADLAGRTSELQTSDFKNRRFADVFAGRQPVGTVVLTLSALAQQAALNGLKNQNGSVVVLDVRTGGVVAAFSNPTYNPNDLATHDAKKAEAARKRLLSKAANNPLLPRAWAERYPPGSTFKTVTASLAFENNIDVDAQFPVRSEIPLPQTNGLTLRNFGGERCGGSLRDGFIVSCNTTFAQVGFDLGEHLADGVENFGVQTTPPHAAGSGIDPPIAMSTGPVRGTFQHNQPGFMQDAIGQHDVAVTPVEMAMVAESVATGGTILQPHVVDCVKDRDNRIVKRVQPAEYKQAMSADTAAKMHDFMLAVVNDPRGTGTLAQIPNISVAGKTGTAETDDGKNPHAWFIVFAPAEAPRYAVAVLVEHGGADGVNAEVTGGRVAAPIARDVLTALLATPPKAPQCA